MRENGKPVLKLFADHYQIENELYWYGLENSHEGKSMEIFADFCRTIRPRVIFDIGANTGIYGLIALAILPKANVSFFEPIPKALEMIEKNLIINNFSGHIFKIALSDFDGEGNFYIPSGQDMAYSITLNAFADEEIDGSALLGMTYDKLREYGIPGGPATNLIQAIESLKHPEPQVQAQTQGIHRFFPVNFRASPDFF